MNNNDHICSNCNSTEVISILYSIPLQAKCAKCHKIYEFGPKMKFSNQLETIRLRPYLYTQYLCEKCHKYNIKIEDSDDLSEEDKAMICHCEK